MKYGCKYLPEQACKHSNKKCDKYHKKRYISYFHNNYTVLNKRKFVLGPSNASSSDFKKNVSCITQIIANKIFPIGVTWKIVANAFYCQ